MKRSSVIKLGVTSVIGAVLIAVLVTAFPKPRVDDECFGRECNESRAVEHDLLEGYRAKISELGASAQVNSPGNPVTGTTDPEVNASNGEQSETSPEPTTPKREHGYYTEHEFAEYRSYTTEVLEELLEGGDLKALPVLVDRYDEKGDYRSMEDASIVASIHGSPRGLASLATFNAPSKLRFDPDSNEDRLELIGSQAFLHAATLLGDSLAEQSARIKLDHFGVAFSDGEKMMVDQLGHSVIDILNDKRNEMGMEPLEANDQPYEP